MIRHKTATVWHKARPSEDSAGTSPPTWHRHARTEEEARDNDVYIISTRLSFEVDVSELVDGNDRDGVGGAAFWLDENADLRDLVGPSSGHDKVWFTTG